MRLRTPVYAALMAVSFTLCTAVLGTPAENTVAPLARPSEAAQSDDGGSVDLSHAERVARRLIASHDCWTRTGPVGVIPGHVVVTRKGHRTPEYLGGKWAGEALDQTFDGQDQGLAIHAYCV